MSFYLMYGKNVLLYWKILTRIFFVLKKKLGNVIHYVIIFLKRKERKGRESCMWFLVVVLLPCVLSDGLNVIAWKFRKEIIVTLFVRRLSVKEEDKHINLHPKTIFGGIISVLMFPNIERSNGVIFGMLKEL